MADVRTLRKKCEAAESRYAALVEGLKARVRQWTDDGRTAEMVDCYGEAKACFEHVIELESLLAAHGEGE